MLKITIEEQGEPIRYLNIGKVKDGRFTSEWFADYMDAHLQRIGFRTFYLHKHRKQNIARIIKSTLDNMLLYEPDPI